MLKLLRIVEDFIDAERAKLGWWDRAFRNYPEVRTTNFYAAYAGKPRFGEEQVIRPSASRRVVAVFLLFFLGLVWMMLLRALLDYAFPMLVILFGFLFVNFLIVLVLRQHFFSGKFNYTITVTAFYIAIDEIRCPWSEIAETCIMSRQEGKTTNNYLILFKKGGSVCKYDLYMFGISNTRLAMIIEYYKNSGKNA